MTELYEKSIRTLELDRVLEMLAAQAVSEEGKARCLARRPETNADDVRDALAQTTAACRLITLKGSPTFHDVKEVAASLDRADRGGSLSTVELLRVAGVLRAARSVKNYADTDAQDSCLDPLFFSLNSNRHLEDRITNSILSEDEIADAASHELADIRRHMRIQSAKARESLQRIISSPTYAKFLQEPIITMRDGRYVVPVKAECKGSIPGLVHDVSSSGNTFFIEPMQSVNANNELRELLLREQKEIERILSELSSEAAAHKDDITSDYEILVELDTIFARAKLSFRMNAIEPELRTDGQLELKRARHPLIDPKKAVPITVRLGSDFDTLVITGPNTGGKTVTLKTLGLMTLMAECGLHLPVDDGSSVNVFETVYADIGDEQSIEQSLSTFSAHMKNITRIVDACDRDSLVLFDELGAGTDPAEGAALAIAVIEFCRQMGARVAATTHYAELKVYAMREKGVINASCEFNVETLQPTYRLLIGVPGKSNAFAIAQKLGLSEDVIKKARSLVGQNDLDFEEVLSQLEAQRQAMEQARAEAEKLRLETQQNKKKSDEYYAEIQREREKAVEKARAEAQRILDEARATANSVYDELKALRKQMHDAADAQGVNERQAELRRSLNEAESRLAPVKKQESRPAPSRAPRAGDTVELLKLGTKATVLSVNKDGSLELQAGIMKVTAKPEEVYLLENEQQKQVKKFIREQTRQMRSAPVSPELDVRGMTVDEAIGVLDIFLDNAMMANLPSVRIIHGKGTGALRRGITEHLKRRKGIKDFRLGVYGEGEDGVTIISLAN